MTSELNNEKMLEKERQEFVNAMVTSLGEKTNKVADILSNTKWSQQRLDQEANQLQQAQCFGSTLQDQNRMQLTEISKCELDASFLSKRNTNLKWQIEEGIQSRLNGKTLELSEVDKQLMLTQNRLEQWRDKLQQARQDTHFADTALTDAEHGGMEKRTTYSRTVDINSSLNTQLDSLIGQRRDLARQI